MPLPNPFGGGGGVVQQTGSQPTALDPWTPREYIDGPRGGEGTVCQEGRDWVWNLPPVARGVPWKVRHHNGVPPPPVSLAPRLIPSLGVTPVSV